MQTNQTPEQALAANLLAALGLLSNPQPAPDQSYPAPKPVRNVRVYIIGPMAAAAYAGVNAACLLWARLWAMGYVPICPHWSALQTMIVPGLTHDEWIEYDLHQLMLCHAALRIDRVTPSLGSDDEEAACRAIGIPCFHGVDELYLNLPPGAEVCYIGPERPVAGAP